MLPRSCNNGCAVQESKGTGKWEIRVKGTVSYGLCQGQRERVQYKVAAHGA